MAEEKKEEQKKSVFETLNALSVNDHKESKNGLSYLSWTWALSEVMKRYPDMSYEIERDENGRMYHYDEKAGYMVNTKVTIEGQTKEMWLPVMDGANKAMLDHPYEYKTRYGKTFRVEAATMFDINKAIMRCLVKNLAMFGLGLYIYAGEDLPESDTESQGAQNKAPQNAPQSATQPVRKVGKGADDLVDEEQIAELKEIAAPNQLDYLKRHYKVRELTELTNAQARKFIESLMDMKKKESNGKQGKTA